MASLANLTDEEIRTYLVKYNLPIVPITDSTRKLLLKKIQTALDGGGSTPNDKKSSKKSTSRSNVSITNDNHIDKDVSSDMLPPASLPTVTRRNSRGRQGTDSPHPYSNRKPSGSSTLDQSTEDLNSSLFSSTSKRRGRSSMASTSGYQNGFETGSDSDVPEKPANNSLSKKRTSPINRSFKSPIFPSVFSNLPTSVRQNDLSPPKSRPATPSVSSNHDAFDFSRKPISGCKYQNLFAFVKRFPSPPPPPLMISISNTYYFVLPTLL